MEKNKEIYEDLSKKYSDEELVEGYLINETLDPEDQKKVDEERNLGVLDWNDSKVWGKKKY